jgi:hypothetical protein
MSRTGILERYAEAYSRKVKSMTRSEVQALVQEVLKELQPVIVEQVRRALARNGEPAPREKDRPVTQAELQRFFGR